MVCEYVRMIQFELQWGWCVKVVHTCVHVYVSDI